MNKQWQKEIRSLQQKKFRKELNRFIVEGRKNVCELLSSSLEIEALFYTANFEEQYLSSLNTDRIRVRECCTQELLEKSGSLQTNDSAIAVVKIPDFGPTPIPTHGFCIALDDIRDPGNLGTIIRIADWYGLEYIICSNACTDVFNPKTIAASMGSFSRIKVFYTDLASWIVDVQKHDVLVAGAFLDGDNIHTTAIPMPMVIVMGNESNGIQPEIERLVNTRLSIPSYGQAESLNVSIATAIICDNLKRK